MYSLLTRRLLGFIHVELTPELGILALVLFITLSDGTPRPLLHFGGPQRSTHLIACHAEYRTPRDEHIQCHGHRSIRRITPSMFVNKLFLVKRRDGPIVISRRAAFHRRLCRLASAHVGW